MNYARVDANPRVNSIIKSKISRMDKISKDAKPGPGTYDSTGAFNKTQVVVKASSMSKSKARNFVE